MNSTKSYLRHPIYITHKYFRAFCNVFPEVVDKPNSDLCSPERVSLSPGYRVDVEGLLFLVDTAQDDTNDYSNMSCGGSIITQNCHVLKRVIYLQRQ